MLKDGLLNDTINRYHLHKCIIRPMAFNMTRWISTDRVAIRGTVHSLPVQSSFKVMDYSRYRTGMALIHVDISRRRADDYIKPSTDGRGHRDKQLHVREWAGHGRAERRSGPPSATPSNSSASEYPRSSTSPAAAFLSLEA